MTQPHDSRPLLLAALALAVLAGPGLAQEATQERVHVVRRGDTLWDLANHYLGNPFLWPTIFEANRSVVEDPHWIYPEERLRIPGLVTATVEQPGAAAGEPTAAAPAQPVAAAEPPPAGVAVAESLDLRRPVIPEAEYYSTPWIEPAIETQLVGRVARLAAEPGSALDKIAPALHPHYRVHVAELRQPASSPGDSLLVVRVGRLVNGIGRVIEPLAVLRVDSVAADVVLATVVTQYDVTRVGDDVLRLERMPEVPRGRAETVANGVEGLLIDFLTHQSLYGTGDHGFVTAGSEPLRLGDELAVYVPVAPLANGGESGPPAEVGRARVVRVANGSATVRLIGVFDTSIRAGLPVRLVARMP